MLGWEEDGGGWVVDAAGVRVGGVVVVVLRRDVLVLDDVCVVVLNGEDPDAIAAPVYLYVCFFCVCLYGFVFLLYV